VRLAAAAETVYLAFRGPHATRYSLSGSHAGLCSRAVRRLACLASKTKREQIVTGDMLPRGAGCAKRDSARLPHSMRGWRGGIRANAMAAHALGVSSKGIRHTQALRHHPHRDAIYAVIAHIKSRAEAGAVTRLGTINSHIGNTGNEMEDNGQRSGHLNPRLHGTLQ